MFWRDKSYRRIQFAWYAIEYGSNQMELKLKDDFIKLGQALKAAGLVDSGLDAKIVIQDGEVSVNGEVETRRGKKLYDGDVVEFDGETIKIVG